MTTTTYITFGTRYASEPHPVDERAHSDGWFEYTAGSYADAVAAAQRHLMADFGATRVPLYAFDYDEEPDTAWYPRGCLARFEATDDVGVREVGA